MKRRQPPKRNAQNVEEDKIDYISIPRHKKVLRKKVKEETCLIGQLSKFDQE